ncbi:MAG: MFS transporter [Clostridia bacterium]
MKNSKLMSWVRLFTLMFSSVIFSLPYIMWTFYVPLQTALNLTDDYAKFGLIMTVFGLTAIPLYLIGGFITDRFNPKTLIAVGLAGTAVCGFVYATIPSFNVVLLLQVLMCFFSIGLYWPSLIKMTRIISNDFGQGLGFGALEGGRKLSYFVMNAMFIAAFTQYGEGVTGLQAALVVIAAQCLVMSILVLLVFKGVNYNESCSESGEKVDFSKVIPLLKKPVIWMISLIILSVYVSSTVQGFVTAYLVNVFGMGEAASAWFFTFTQFAAPLVVVLGGWLTDKAGVAKGLLVAQLLLLLTIGGLLVAPVGPTYLVIAMGTLLIFLVALYVVRGIYWTLLKFTGIPVVVSGTAIGVISMIAYLPDAFMYNFAGSLIDANPGAVGYHNLFLIQLTVGAVGVVLTLILTSYMKKHKPSELYANICKVEE